VVREFECGLLYRHGKFRTRLEAGRHVRWGFGYALATMDLRKQTFAVAGQEVLSADNVGLKVSVAVTVQVSDPVQAMHEVQDWRGHLYLANAARLLESNPALQDLRLMQSISAPGNTLVLGLPTGFVPLKPGKAATIEPRGNDLDE
jgi:regulator of protease activity HflC (stomatin/prohibitin superfamily)